MKTKKVPKLRFPVFTEEWEEVQLSDVVDRITQKNNKLISKLPLTISAEYGLVDQITFFNKNVASTDLSNYYLLTKGDFAYNKSYSKGYPWGAVKRLDRYNDGVVSSLYICFKPKNIINSDFLTHYYETSKWYKEVSQIAVEGARNHGLLNIQVGDFFKTKLFKSNVSEQNKIAIFLNSVDKKIENQEQIISKFETIKKGYLQKIFSQEIRFKDQDGNEFPEWEEKRVDQLFQVTRGRVIAKTSISDVQNEEYKYPIYSSQTSNNGIMGYDDKFDFEGNYITWTTDGANAGKVFARTGKFNCTNVCGLLVEKLETKGYANHFISESLDRVTRKYVSYVGNPKLMNNVMAEIIINVPSLNEQKIIADFISIFDQKIDIEKQKLEKWKQIKEGLLQQMFV